MATILLTIHAAFSKNQSCKICSKDGQVSFFPIYLQEYKLAQFHCYGRYLAKHLQRGLTLLEVAELDAEGFYKMHLTSGFDDLALSTMVVSSSFPKITNDVKHRPHCLGNIVYWLADQINCRYQWSPYVCLIVWWLQWTFRTLIKRRGPEISPGYDEYDPQLHCTFIGK